MRKELASVLLLCLINTHVLGAAPPPPPPRAGNTYYVDCSGGNDSNSGTSTAAPWLHFPWDDSASGSVVSSLSAGDTVVAKGGVTCSGTSTVLSARRVVSIRSSGTLANPITYRSGDLHTPTWGTGRAVIDGQGPGVGAAKTGIYISQVKGLVIEGFEIKNIGVPTVDAAGIEVQKGGGNADDTILQYLLIHDINWSGTYTRGYGIENNHGSNLTVQYSEIYNATDKLVEYFGGTTQGAQNANNGLIQWNYLHDSSIHCIVLTGTDNTVRNNLIDNCENGARSGAGNPGFSLKVDQGERNKIYNNVAQRASSCWGVLVGNENEFNHNICEGVGTNGGGTHGGSAEGGLVFYNNDNSWGTTGMDGNIFKNNIVCYIPNANTTTKPKLIYHNKSGGNNNIVEGNLFQALNGDTTATATRIRSASSTVGFGTNTYYSVAAWEPLFNTLMNGTGNTASNNYADDPDFTGGACGSMTGLPDGFLTDYTDLNTQAYQIGAGGMVTGETLASPYDIDLRGNMRPPWWPGIYSASITPPVPGNSGTITTSSVTSTTFTMNWTAATGTATLTYKGCISGSPITTEAECNAATMLFDYTAAITSYDLTGLSPLATYYVNVIVMDGDGLTALYTSKSQTMPCGATKLVFTSQPLSASIGGSLGNVVVSVENASDTKCTDSSVSIVIANTGGTCTGMTLNGTKTGNAVLGDFATSNLNQTGAAGSCTLTATSSGLTSAISDIFSIFSAGIGSGRLRIAR